MLLGEEVSVVQYLRPTAGRVRAPSQQVKLEINDHCSQHSHAITALIPWHQDHYKSQAAGNRCLLIGNLSGSSTRRFGFLTQTSGQIFLHQPPEVRNVLVSVERDAILLEPTGREGVVLGQQPSVLGEKVVEQRFFLGHARPDVLDGT